MPNWCNNIVTLNHKDPAQIKRVQDCLEKGLFNEFIPMPEQLRNTVVSTATPEEEYAKNTKEFGFPSWYEFSYAKWGTKWDANEVEVLAQNDNSIKLVFDTAWSPPIPFYEELCGQGFDVEAYYSEPGMCFCGSFENGIEETIEYDASSLKSLKKSCPAIFIEMFTLDDWFEEEEAEAE